MYTMALVHLRNTFLGLRQPRPRGRLVLSHGGTEGVSMSTFMSSAEAFRKARERRSVAETFEANLLHMAIFDARAAGMSVRQAARALNVPKSTVARHWREGHRCPATVPTWGSESAWRDAHAMIWAHDPQELADDVVPWEWSVLDSGAHEIRRKFRGVARLRHDTE